MKQVNIHIGYVISILFILSSCSERTPSDVRFERVTGIELPYEFKVLDDNYESSWADYSLTYRIVLEQPDCLEFMDYIVDETSWKDNPAFGKWRFHRTKDGTEFKIYFFPMDCEIHYYESHI